MLNSWFMIQVGNLSAPVEKWAAGGTALTSLMDVERRHRNFKPVIKKAMVELEGAPFKKFLSMREEWAIKNRYISLDFLGHLRMVHRLGMFNEYTIDHPMQVLIPLWPPKAFYYLEPCCLQELSRASTLCSRNNVIAALISFSSDGETEHAILWL
ncbi:UNVERIFIED_CONTAM: Pyrophosphate--fructose 6-phosphate 1-phosphotransferase subunit beta 2 [Sesamum indicum]